MGLSAKAESSGTCGPNLKWHLTDDGVLSITGKGEMYGYSNRGPWGSSIKRVIIGDGVTTIGNVAFGECRSLTSVIIPNSGRIQRANALRHKVIKSFRKNTQKEYKNLIFLLVGD